MKKLVLVAILAMLAFGCGKKDEDKAKKAGGEKPTPNEKTVPEEQTPTPDEPAGPSELATEEDFEDEASKSITSDNLEKQIAEMDEEVGE